MNTKPRITRSSNVKNTIALEKSKHCIVRLEDIKSKQRTGAPNASTPQQQNKAKPRILVSSAVKKTPLQKILPKVPQTAPPRQQQQQQQTHIIKKKLSSSQDDDLDSIDLSSFGRSRRTPKPNVKYFNDSVVTVKPGKKLKIDDEEEEDGEEISSDIDFEDEREDNASDFEITDEEEEAPPPPKKTRLSNSSTLVTQTSRPQLVSKQSQSVVSKANTAPPTRQMRTIVPVTKMAVKKPTIVEKPPTATPTANKKPSNIVTYTANNRTLVTRKRPLETTPQSSQKTVQPSTQKTVPRLAPRPPQQATTQRTVQQTQPRAVAPKTAQQVTQKPVQKTVNNVQPQAIKPKPANVTNNATGKSYTVVRKSTAAAVLSPPATKKEAPKKVTPQTTTKKKPEESVNTEEDEENDESDTNNDNLEEDIGNPMALNTIDDFEAMPTFTIVNINDIINKKGDVLMQQTFPKSDDTADEEKKPEEKQEIASKNRRKATHTVLKEEPSTKSPPPKTPFPPIAPKKVFTSPPGQLKQVMGKKVLISPPPQVKKIIASPPAAQKPPVRILNSGLCRQQTPISPIINAQKQQQLKTSPATAVVKKEPLQPQQPKQPTVVKREPQATPIIKKVLSPVKQPVNNNIIKKQPTQQQPSKRKLPDEKITVQRQGTKTIKKMTCFENWYVVHCPENQAPLKPAPNQLTLPLIRIANTLQDICLPSEKWTSKVALSLIPDLVFQRGQFEKYVGNYHDKALIKDDIKHRYQPASILFRRAQKPNAIDRTVILKNRTFLIYIQGKAVQLVGSPSIIKDLQDIESLLDCVDHLALDSDDVDITPNPPI